MIIKRLQNKEYNLLSKYINNFYKKGHILSKYKKLFDWMYFDPKTRKYNFLIAKDKIRIIATKGFQPLKLYDNNLGWETFISMWSSTRPTAGIKLFDVILKKKYDFICGIGSSKYSLKYQKYKKFKIGQLKHSYLLSKKTNHYKIASISKYPKKFKNSFFGKEYIRLNSRLLKSKELQSLYDYQTPQKSSFYLINRYLNSKFYDYYAYGSIKNNKIINIVILRNCNYKKKTAVRIIDYIGSNYSFKYLDKLFHKILEKKKIEYIDLYSFGIPDKEILKCGFKIKNSKDKNIIPNYFEPFERKNKNIIFGYLLKKKIKNQIRLFKGDSDMDRPNRLK